MIGRSEPEPPDKVTGSNAGRILAMGMGKFAGQRVFSVFAGRFQERR
jgi:hypothetical protein